jgi:hypothetical protein
VELNKYEIWSLKKISKWEKEKHEGFHKKILDVISKPVDYLIKKIGPEKLKMFESAIGATINKMLYASTYTVNPKELIKRAHEHGIEIKDPSELKTCNLKLLDECNRKHIKFHERASAVQGAAAGIGGGLVATVDLTAVLVQDFHMLQEIAFCYGYDPNDIIEKEIILRIIEAGIGGSEVKFKALKEIETLRRMEEKRTETEAAGKRVSVLGAKALEEYIEDLTMDLLARLIPRALPIPVVTMAISAHSDHEIMENSGNTAFMVYRKRFIERKKEL